MSVCKDYGSSERTYCVIEKLPEITRNYQKLPKFYQLPGFEKGKNIRVMGNLSQLPGNYQVITKILPILNPGDNYLTR